MKLEEFDKSQEALFNPVDIVRKLTDCPKTVITCFAADLVEYAAKEYGGKVIGHYKCANGEIPLFRLDERAGGLGLIMSLVGAPAVVSQYEELFAMGVEKILVFGNCGVLDSRLEDCSIIVPDRAVRDEGTSFHYEEPGDEIAVNVCEMDRMTKFFAGTGVQYTTGKVWTTDGIYRETRDKVAKRKAEGCICVEMECAAIAALAKFRNRSVSQFFYCADNLDSDVWIIRSLVNETRTDVKQKIMDLAVALGREL